MTKTAAKTDKECSTSGAGATNQNKGFLRNSNNKAPKGKNNPKRIFANKGSNNSKCRLKVVYADVRRSLQGT